MSFLLKEWQKNAQTVHMHTVECDFSLNKSVLHKWDFSEICKGRLTVSPRGARPHWLGPSSAQMLGSAWTGPTAGSGTLALAWQTISRSSSILCVNTLIRVTHVCSSRVTENSTNAVGHSCLLLSFRGTSL